MTCAGRRCDGILRERSGVIYLDGLTNKFGRSIIFILFIYLLFHFIYYFLFFIYYFLFFCPEGMLSYVRGDLFFFFPVLRRDWRNQRINHGVIFPFFAMGDAEPRNGFVLFGIFLFLKFCRAGFLFSLPLFALVFPFFGGYWATWWGTFPIFAAPVVVHISR